MGFCHVDIGAVQWLRRGTSYPVQICTGRKVVPSQEIIIGIGFLLRLKPGRRPGYVISICTVLFYSQFLTVCADLQVGSKAVTPTTSVDTVTDKEGETVEAASPAAVNKAKGKAVSPTAAEKGKGKAVSPTAAEKGKQKAVSPSAAEKGKAKASPPTAAEKGKGKAKVSPPTVAEKGKAKVTEEVVDQRQEELQLLLPEKIPEGLAIIEETEDEVVWAIEPKASEREPVLSINDFIEIPGEPSPSRKIRFADWEEAHAENLLDEDPEESSAGDEDELSFVDMLMDVVDEADDVPYSPEVLSILVEFVME